MWLMNYKGCNHHHHHQRYSHIRATFQGNWGNSYEPESG